MRGFVAIREAPNAPHLYMLVPDAELRRPAISAVLAGILSAGKQMSPGAFMYMVFAELAELLEAYELYTYPQRLICEPGEDMDDAYPLLDLTHCSMSWCQLGTAKVTTRVSFETTASLAA